MEKKVVNTAKEIDLDTLMRLQLTNSPKLPQMINHRGRRKSWVGIGWVDEGPATGKEIRVKED